MSKTSHDETRPNQCQYKPLREVSLNEMVLITTRSSVSVETGSKCKCSTIIVLSVVGLILFWVLSTTFHPAHHVANVLRIEIDKPPTHVTDSRFVSIGLDSSVIAEGFKKFDMGSPKLRNMVRHLGPGYLRVGGTLADRLFFTPNDTLQLKTNYFSLQDGDVCAYEDRTCSAKLTPNFTLSGTEWLQLNQLAAGADFIILFDLNGLMRNANGSWNATNAEELIAFSDRNNLSVIWELGNEPNSFEHVFNYSVNATQMAKDFGTLRKLLNKYPRYRKSFLVGPSVTRPIPENKASVAYLKEFLSSAARVISAVTWHQYYFNGRTATADDFINPDVFNLLESQTDTILDVVDSHGLQGTPVWLGETAAAYGGGAPGYNNRYIGTFIWLDKLGLAARKGLDVVVRQSIFKGFYALLDNNYDPTPDYWISVLYKKFVGPEVVPCYSASCPRVRLYCQCTNKEFMRPAVTVYGMNMKETEAVIRLQGFTASKTDKIYVYVLSPHMSLFSRNVYLNKETLVMDSDGNLPSFKPYVLQKDAPVVLPPFSTVFIVIPTEALACNED